MESCFKKWWRSPWKEKKKEKKTIKAVEADEIILAGEAANNGADEAVEDDLVTSVDNTDLLKEVTPDADLKFTCDLCDYTATSQQGLNATQRKQRSEIQSSIKINKEWTKL